MGRFVAVVWLLLAALFGLELASRRAWPSCSTVPYGLGAPDSWAVCRSNGAWPELVSGSLLASCSIVAVVVLVTSQRFERPWWWRCRSAGSSSEPPLRAPRRTLR